MFCGGPSQTGESNAFQNVWVLLVAHLNVLGWMMKSYEWGGPMIMKSSVDDAISGLMVGLQSGG